jgi:tetratricopeptide (TPR) repeat protein
MRGQWAEAVERCTEALRADPQSAAAHSLLGDIYENQGRLDKASHWYQLALEQNPESIADKAKLARVRELQAVRRRTGDPRFSWAYLVAVAGVAFLFVAFVMAAVVAGDRNRGAPSALKDTPTPQFPPSAIPRVQPLDHTDEEEKLAKFLIERLGSQYVRVVTVTLNPQDRDVIVTARLTDHPITPDPKGGSRRDHLLREGYRIAFLARGQQLEQKRDLQYVTVRVLDRLKGPVDEVWRGRIFARNIAVSDDLASVGEVRSVYFSQWWNPMAGF